MRSFLTLLLMCCLVVLISCEIKTSNPMANPELTLPQTIDLFQKSNKTYLDQLYLLSRISAEELSNYPNGVFNIEDLVVDESVFTSPKLGELHQLDRQHSKYLLENLMNYRAIDIYNQNDTVIVDSVTINVKAIDSSLFFSGTELKDVYDAFHREFPLDESNRLLSIRITEINKNNGIVSFTFDRSLVIDFSTLPILKPECETAERKSFSWDAGLNGCNYVYSSQSIHARFNDRRNGHAYIEDIINTFHRNVSGIQCNGGYQVSSRRFIGTAERRVFYPWHYPAPSYIPNQKAILTRCVRNLNLQTGHDITYWRGTCIPAAEINFYINKAVEISNEFKPHADVHLSRMNVHEAGIVTDPPNMDCQWVSYYFYSNYYKPMITIRRTPPNG